MSDTPTPTDDLTDEQVFEILNRYHEIARGNGALELVAAEIASGPGGHAEILDEVLDTASELGFHDVRGAAWEKMKIAVGNYGTRLARELETAKLEVGEKVRIAAPADSNLGVMRHAEESRFVGSVPGGTEGTFAGMHPNERLSGWALVNVDPALVDLGETWTLEDLGNPETLVVPVHATTIEKIQ